MNPLASFHPAVRTWFERTFPAGPTAAQERGWPTIAEGRDTLIAAPTGSGKTLSAFLVGIDQLYRAAEAGVALGEGVRVVYVSPLKALAADIHQNLEAPLAQIRQVALELGLDAPDVRVALRSGDTKPSQRAAMLRKPPDMLMTTPESLYLMVTAEKSREILRGATTVIVDEIHALARDKRGSHLTLTLERLDALCEERPTRIGLSATQRPLETVSRLLVGAGEDRSEPNGEPRCAVVDEGHRRKLDLALELPQGELEAVSSAEQVSDVLDRIAEQVRAHATTLVFVNTRRLAERLAHQLAERLGDEGVAAHHGSLSRDRRLKTEAQLRAGDLRVLVATASLELGIDVGPIELVCQIGSPRSMATFLQRVGRSGHFLGGVPKGRLYPLTRDELIECAALLRGIGRGHLDALHPPTCPLDILAQHLVAACACEAWKEDDLYALARRAAPFAELSRQDFDEIVDLLSDGIETGNGRRAAYLHRDRINGVVRGRRGARIAAITSGGAIPEMGDYRVLADPNDTPVGTVGEDWAIESMAGDIFLLGSTSWQIRRVESGVVRVRDAGGAPPTVPFWVGEAPARTAELSHEVSELRAGVAERLADGAPGRAAEWVAEECGLDEAAASQVVQYLAACRTALGALPTQEEIVYERFFDESGGMQLVVHAPFGGRINRALGLALRKRFCKSFDFELQAAANDDAVVLSLGPQHSFPLSDTVGFLRSGSAKEVLSQALLASPMFAVRWRWNLNRSLAVLRFRGGRRNPAPIQRMEADDLMAAVFPGLAACQENATGPIEIPDHPIVRQTIDDCLNEAMDIEGLTGLLRRIEAGEVATRFVDTTEPSPLSHEILSARPYTFLDDAPLEERRTRAVVLRRGLPVEARELGRLDADAIARVREESRPAPRSADELHDVLLHLGVVRPNEQWPEDFDALVSQGRALRLHLGAPGSESADAGAQTLWCVSERAPALAVLWPGAQREPDTPLPDAITCLPTPSEEDTTAMIVRGHLEISGPVTVAALAAATALREGRIEIALGQLEVEGFAMRGHFTPAEARPESPLPLSLETLRRLERDACAPLDPSDDTQPRSQPAPVVSTAAAVEAPEEFCARRLLTRIHRYTQDRLRKEIEPVTAQDFIRFLLRWHHVAPGTQRSGRSGTLAAIEQLQGFELAAGSWEDGVLPSRVEGYRGDWLDALCLAGEVVWGRLSLRATSGAEEDERRGGAVPSRATPLTLALRADLSWLLQAARGDGTPGDPGPGAARDVAECLAARGALFHSDLVASVGRLPVEVEEGLWELVSRGLVTADGFQAVRGLLGSRERWARRQSRARARRGLRRGLGTRGRGGSMAEGRWALFAQPGLAGADLLEPATGMDSSGATSSAPPPAIPGANADADELAEAVAEQLLARWGVVFRDLMTRESTVVPWRDLLWAFRRMEARGVIRGGRFVSGFVGEQYALPGAVDALRRTRRLEHGGEVVRLQATDPLNLVGILTPGPRIPAIRTNQVIYRDGLPIDESDLAAESEAG